MPSTPINVVADGSSNITKTRVYNVSIVTIDSVSFYQNSKDLGANSENVEKVVELVLVEIRDLTSRDLKIINSFVVDTYNLIKAVNKKLVVIEGIESCFIVPCDLHGGQLLIKDILLLDTIRPIQRDALEVVSSFKSLLL